jgi:hypothetical protein
MNAHHIETLEVAQAFELNHEEIFNLLVSSTSELPNFLAVGGMSQTNLLSSTHVVFVLRLLVF